MLCTRMACLGMYSNSMFLTVRGQRQGELSLLSPASSSRNAQSKQGLGPEQSPNRPGLVSRSLQVHRTLNATERH
jgi:hypothetical protein